MTGGVGFTQSTKEPKSAVPGMADDVDLEEIARHVIDCGFALHYDLGPGLLESAYESFLAAALRERGLTVEQQRAVAVTYKGVAIKEAFRVDLLVQATLIVEIKSVERLSPVHSKQLLTYLRLTNSPLGLLINFGETLFKEGAHRVINNRSSYRAPQI
jgi:GxxExxY protein